MGLLGSTLNSWWIGRLPYSLRNPERFGKHSNRKNLHLFHVSSYKSVSEMLTNFWLFQDSRSYHLSSSLVISPLITGTGGGSSCKASVPREKEPLSQRHSAWPEPTRHRQPQRTCPPLTRIPILHHQHRHLLPTPLPALTPLLSTSAPGRPLIPASSLQPEHGGWSRFTGAWIGFTLWKSMNAKWQVQN